MTQPKQVDEWTRKRCYICNDEIKGINDVAWKKNMDMHLINRHSDKYAIQETKVK